ncbi:glutamyl-tRNA(Gln) amidotransferase subunit B, mitochondrial [Trichonephila inaurata madagascariensis]|uniref:Glutamyl-tRNA(Gln) amidotransferase subunit B, mitochondrial n=1 Tax=Trichonephila inaurata madagascariensis TaxID=2747483 RepID=A0A8X6XVE7_9ARAC|nr:glutamyl-tRNA(Gln) amidotransferase subunit B, mitochondrial [Trichonephila inaurata madagascariensis]
MAICQKIIFSVSSGTEVIFRSIFKKSFSTNLFLNFSAKINAKEDTSLYQGVVGLEVHAQINSKSKLFSSSPAEYGSSTNTKVSFFDAALPGTLPVLNKSCIEAGILTALACNCTVNKVSTFDRKHYFYPDLPAGYQITQQFRPLASNGVIIFVVPDAMNISDSYECIAYLKQIQLEQDSGRSLHVKDAKSLVDLNRAGIGLMELVFEPNLKNGTEAAALVKELICILKRIETCSCELEEGTFRVDANISVNKIGDPLGTRTEVKNINSLRYIARAIDYEIERQIEILKNGGSVINETRAYDYTLKKTIFMRDKEVLQDYRFMPEPNLPPIRICDEQDKGSYKNVDNVPNIDEIKRKLPVLPETERSILMNNYQLPLHIADKIVQSEGLRNAFEIAASRINDCSAIWDFFLYVLQSQLNSMKLSFKKCGLSGDQVADIIELLVLKRISEATARDVLEMLLNGDNRTAQEIVKEYNWFLISDEKELRGLCEEVISKYLKVAKKYKNSGKQRYMTTLLVALNEMVNNRASIKDAEEVFKKLIQENVKTKKDS